VSLFVSGCRNRCRGCFNPETWSFSHGKLFDESVAAHILKLLEPPHISGLTLLGGEPFEPENQRELLKLLREVRAKFQKKDIWAYTGYIFERDLFEGGRAHCAATDEMLSLIDILVDGPFIDDRKNISLRFRGSDNQRIIDLRRTREEAKTVLWGKPPTANARIN